MVNTPVLFETFARPDYARQAFDAIKRAQPRILYFYSNKARSDRPDEVKRNETIRAFIKEIDWDCELHTFFREEYVDVYVSLWGALDWFFDNVEEGIVLEEDCVATNAFFNFCDKLLPKYRNEPKVRFISGNNQTPEYNPAGFDYFFSHTKGTYGWASWSAKWKDMDRNMRNWPIIRKNQIKKYYPHFLESLFRIGLIEKFYRKELSLRSWDVVMSYDMIEKNQVSVVPKFNLVDDIGVLGVNHAVSTSRPNSLPVFDKDDYPIERYPETIEPIDSYDYRHFKKNILKRFIIYEIKKYYKLFLHK